MATLVLYSTMARNFEIHWAKRQTLNHVRRNDDYHENTKFKVGRKDLEMFITMDRCPVRKA